MLAGFMGVLSFGLRDSTECAIGNSSPHHHVSDSSLLGFAVD